MLPMICNQLATTSPKLIYNQHEMAAAHFVKFLRVHPQKNFTTIQSANLSVNVNTPKLRITGVISQAGT